MCHNINSYNVCWLIFFFRKTNDTMNRLIRSHMKPRQVGKHVVETFKVQIQQFLQCALTIEVTDERRRAETLSKLVNNSSEAMGSTLMRACTWTPDLFILVRRRWLARHNCHYHRIIWETWKWLATSEGTRHRLQGDHAAVIMGCDFGCNMFVLEKKYW